MTRRARCLNVRLYRTRVDHWVCRAHGAVLVERSKESIAVSPEAYGVLCYCRGSLGIIRPPLKAIFGYRP